jgi:hypothetical protein
MNTVLLISCSLIVASVVVSAKKIGYGQSVNLEKDKCTSIGVGPKAMKDGST